MNSELVLGLRGASRWMLPPKVKVFFYTNNLDSLFVVGGVS